MLITTSVGVNIDVDEGLLDWLSLPGRNAQNRTNPEQESKVSGHDMLPPRKVSSAVELAHGREAGFFG